MRLGPNMGSCNPPSSTSPNLIFLLFPQCQVKVRLFVLICQTGPVTTLEHQCLYRLGSPRFEVLSARCTIFLQSRVVVRLFYITASTSPPLVLKDTSLLFSSFFSFAIKVCQETEADLTGKMGKTIIHRIPNSRVPRFSNKLLRQGISNHFTTTILVPTLQSKTNLRRLHRLSQHWQIFHHKYPAQEKSVQDCTHCRGDQSMAIHHVNETNLLD